MEPAPSGKDNIQDLLGYALGLEQQNQEHQQQLQSAAANAKMASLLSQIEQSRQQNEQTMGQWVGKPQQEQPQSLEEMVQNMPQDQIDESTVPFGMGAGMAGIGTTLSPYLIGKTSGNTQRAIKGVFQPDVVALNRAQGAMQKGAQKAISGAEKLAASRAGQRGAGLASMAAKGSKYLPKVAGYLPKVAGWPALVASLADASLQMTDENGEVYQTLADKGRTKLATSLMDILGDTGMGATTSGILTGLVSGGADLVLAPMGIAEKLAQQTFNGSQYEWDLANPITGEL